MTINLQQAKVNLAAAWQAFDEQEKDPQTQGNSAGAASISYWSKVVELLEGGIEIPQKATVRQILETPIYTIKQGYVYCCDHSNPYGYQSVLRIAWLGLSQEEIEIAKWKERVLEQCRYCQSDEEKVNKIRHTLTPYDAWRKRGDDYLTAFMRANSTIAERIPELAKTAIAQIKRKQSLTQV